MIQVQRTHRSAQCIGKSLEQVIKIGLVLGNRHIEFPMKEGSEEEIGDTGSAQRVQAAPQIMLGATPMPSKGFPAGYFSVRPIAC